MKRRKRKWWRKWKRGWQSEIVRQGDDVEGGRKGRKMRKGTRRKRNGEWRSKIA